MWDRWTDRYDTPFVFPFYPTLCKELAHDVTWLLAAYHNTASRICSPPLVQMRRVQSRLINGAEQLLCLNRFDRMKLKKLFCGLVLLK
jgi:hypothetical protein